MPHCKANMFYFNDGLFVLSAKTQLKHRHIFLGKIFNLRIRKINICGFLREPVETEKKREGGRRKVFFPRAHFVVRFITTRLFTIGQRGRCQRVWWTGALSASNLLPLLSHVKLVTRALSCLRLLGALKIEGPKYVTSVWTPCEPNIGA